jgi:hypothetical protein
MKFFAPVVLALLATASTSAAFAPAGKLIYEREHRRIEPPQSFIAGFQMVRILNFL